MTQGVYNHWKIRGKKISESHRLNMKHPKTKEHKLHMKHPKTLEHKQHISEGRKEIWKNLDYRNNQVKSTIKNLPNPIFPHEKQFIQICKDNNFPFIFVGHGELIIEGLVPDFIDSNGRKLIVEIHFSKDTTYENKRKEVFSKYGYNTLFLYPKDFENNTIVQRVREFRGE